MVCTAFVAVATSAQAERSVGLSTDITDSRTLAIQGKVDKLYDAGDFERAYFIYRNELAPLGDKYAQYMVGFMHVTGKGVAADDVQASAWYRLASERDTPEFVAVRNRLMDSLRAEQVRRSDVLYAALLAEYSDLAVLLAAIKRDMALVSNRTGSRLHRGGGGPVSIVNGRSGAVKSEAAYFRRIDKRIEVCLQRIVEIGQFEDIDPDPDRVDMDELERLVEERIANWQG